MCVCVPVVSPLSRLPGFPSTLPLELPYSVTKGHLFLEGRQEEAGPSRVRVGLRGELWNFLESSNGRPGWAALPRHLGRNGSDSSSLSDLSPSTQEVILASGHEPSPTLWWFGLEKSSTVKNKQHPPTWTAHRHSISHSLAKLPDSLGILRFFSLSSHLVCL